MNLNGVQDDNEPSEPAALTEIDGSARFEFDEAFDVDASGMIDDDEGQWVLLAGIDRSTELPLGLRLVAPMGIFVVSPLSTLMAGLMRDHEFDMIGGEARVLAALDLPPVELADLNLPLEGSNGNANAAELFAASAQIQNTVVAAASLLRNIPGAVPFAVLGDSAFADLAAKIADEDSSLDLANPILVSSIIEGMLYRSGLSLSADQIAGAGQAIAAVNLLIQNVPNTANTAYLENVARIQKVAQGDLATALGGVGGGSTAIATVVADFTGAAQRPRHWRSYWQRHSTLTYDQRRHPERRSGRNSDLFVRRRPGRRIGAASVGGIRDSRCHCCRGPRLFVGKRDVELEPRRQHVANHSSDSAR